MGGGVGNVPDIGRAKAVGAFGEGNLNARLREQQRGGEIDVVGINVANRLGENVFVRHGNLVGGEQRSDSPSVATTCQNGAQLPTQRPVHGRLNLPPLVGMEKDGNLPPQDGLDRLPGRNHRNRRGTGGRRTGLTVRLGLTEELVDLLELLVAGLDLILQRLPLLGIGGAFLGGRVQTEGRPKHMESGVLAEGHFLDGPAVEGDHGGVTADDRPQRNGLGMGVPVGARHGDEFGIGIHRLPGIDIRSVLAGLSGIPGGPNGVNFLKSKNGRGRDQPREDVLFLQVEHLVGGTGRGGADRDNLAVTD